MESCNDLHDWELVLGSDLSDNLIPVVAPEDETEDFALQPNYFTADLAEHHSSQSEKENDEGIDDSDNPCRVEPDSDSRLLETTREQSDFSGVQLPMQNADGFWSDESFDEQRSLADSENVDVGSLGDSLMEMASKGIAARSENVGGESEGSEISGTRDMIPAGGGSIDDGGKRGNVWWKMPVELLKFCIFRVRPVWSLSIVAAMVGFVMLVRKLYRMKHKSRSIPLRIAIDDKKTSQFAAGAARFNEAISVVRRMPPIIRPSLTAGGVTQLSALPLR